MGLGVAMIVVVSGFAGSGAVSGAFGRAGAAPAVHTLVRTQIYPSQNPSSRDQVQMAYDPVLKESVLFGGYLTSVAAVGDTGTFA